MREHDQTRSRASRCAWCWFILVASAVAGTIQAQEEPGTNNSGYVHDPIDLAADRVQAWNVGPDRWFLLTGKVAVLQGDDGLRAQQAVVRVRNPDTPGVRGYDAEVYAEGDVRRIGPFVEPVRVLRMSLRSYEDVQLKPYDDRGLSHLDGPPRDSAILDRAFPPTAFAATSSPVQARPPASTPNPFERDRTPLPPLPSEPAPREIAAAPPPMELPPAVGDPLATAGAAGASAQNAPGTAVQTAGGPAPPAGLSDRALTRTQFEAEGAFRDTNDSGMEVPSLDDEPERFGSDEETVPPASRGPFGGNPLAPDSGATIPGEGPGTTLEALPGPDGRPLPPLDQERVPRPGPEVVPDISPIIPDTQRITEIHPRNGGPEWSFQTLPTTPDGVSIAVIRGGVEIISRAKQYGVIDISADSAIIWRRGTLTVGPNGEQIEDAGQPMEVYLEGNVVFLQDARKVAGNGDQKTLRAKQAYYDFRTSRFVGFEAEINMFGPGMIAPARVFSPRIDQFRPLKRTPDGKLALGMEEIHADSTLTTGSRFPNPGYSFTSSSSDMRRVVSTQTEPNTGRPVGNPRDPNTPQDLTWRIDSRQNVFWLGPVPVFYWPRFLGNADDLEPPLRAFIFRTNNYFGQQFLTDFNAFRLFGIDRPKWIDQWNFDVDVLTARGVALGSEIGWFGKGLLQDLTDPYRQRRRGDAEPGSDYFGYFDIWGLRDSGNDVLGSGPAIITNNNAQANKGFQRSDLNPFQQFRGKITGRHMQSFLSPYAEQDEDFRLQLEVGYVSDRHFLEEYYKRIFDTGLDQETLAYLIRQKENRAWSLWTEANLNNWYTESQWLPRGDYYRFGDSLLGNRFTYFQHSGADFANTHTAAEVNNPFIFAYIPYDPISNTSQNLSAGRFYTNHELDMPLQFDFLRLIPYVQGQAVGWTNQINDQPVGRLWGAAGARASVMAWRAFPSVQSELFNVHGLNHKINLDVDARLAWSNVKLDQIGVQDDLDDNTYEFTRRYFALTNFAGGLLPPQYDPRHLMLRRVMSPISGPTDIQSSLDTVQFNLHQRLQTKRGPEGRRRVIDYMTLDLSTTYFPYAARDNFNKPFGQNMYNWQWFVGDRTSVVSYGWFEFWNIGGRPIYNTNIDRHNNPFGLNVITSGLSISRPPRGNIFLGYTVIDTGPINTSALNTSISYWLSPKWYGSYSTMYDFGNAILLASLFSFTRVGADYLTTVGLTVDPQRNSYMFAFMLAPRISPNIRLGSGPGMSMFDSRYAPTQ